jgi:hypothetical protein
MFMPIAFIGIGTYFLFFVGDFVVWARSLVEDAGAD